MSSPCWVCHNSQKLGQWIPCPSFFLLKKKTFFFFPFLFFCFLFGYGTTHTAKLIHPTQRLAISDTMGIKPGNFFKEESASSFSPVYWFDIGLFNFFWIRVGGQGLIVHTWNMWLKLKEQSQHRVVYYL